MYLEDESKKTEINNLTIEKIVTYLLENNLITEKNIVKESVRITEIRGRNKNFQVAKKGISYHLKQPYFDESYKESYDTLEIEHHIYNLMSGEAPIQMIPNLICYDKKNKVMIVELLSDHISFEEYYFKSRRIEQMYFKQVGIDMAAYHKHFSHRVKKGEMRFLGEYNPLKAIVYPSPKIFFDISSGQLELIKIVQHSFIDEEIKELIEEWSKETVIHGDFRWNNILIPRKPGQGRPKIIDWELATIGDPAWDIGGMLQEYAKHWTFLVAKRKHGISYNLPINRQKLEYIRCGIRHFWHSYCHSRDLGNLELDSLLVKSIKMCAVRLIQTGFEFLQASPNISSYVVFLLQLSQNIIKDPYNASIYIFGISFNSF